MIWPFTRDSRAAPRQTLAGEQAAASSSAADALLAVAATLPDPFLVLDSEGIVILANRHAREALDTDPAGEHISATIRAPVILDAVVQVVATGEAVRTDYERRSPLDRRFEAFIAPIARPGQDESPRGTPAVLILLRDLTRQQQLERMRVDFVAHASHELRTPLASLLGFIETLQGPARNDDRVRERFLGLMQAQAERMRRLINDLLSLSRIEMNAHDRPSTLVDLAIIAKQVCEMMAGIARENDVAIETSLPPEMPVQGDHDELVQVIQNLIENAVKYASSGRRIVVSGLVRQGVLNGIELSVRDFGPGIAPEHLPRLTERFYRVNVQESRSRGGTGLGLAIVKHILNRHRGRLTISSETGEGSTFTVKLPTPKTPPAPLSRGP
jgi:two-component system, OmpR family, phosphate regulon sensor histidine kinase PhoR